MKTRIIKHLSTIPEKLGKLVPRSLDTRNIGIVPQLCPLCNKTNHRLHKYHRDIQSHHNSLSNLSNSILCDNCHNVYLILSPKHISLAQSMLRVERFAFTISTTTNEYYVRQWCLNNIVHRPMIDFLNIDKSLNPPKLGPTKVSSRTYINMLRLVMLNITATNPRYLKFLIKNKINIRGYKYLTYAEPYVKIFGNADPTEIDFESNYPDRPRLGPSSESFDRATRDLLSMLSTLTPSVFSWED